MKEIVQHNVLNSITIMEMDVVNAIQIVMNATVKAKMNVINAKEVNVNIKENVQINAHKDSIKLDQIAYLAQIHAKHVIKKPLNVHLVQKV